MVPCGLARAMFQDAIGALQLLVALNAGWIAVYGAVLWYRSGEDAEPVAVGEHTLMRGEVAWFAVAFLAVAALNAASLPHAATGAAPAEPPAENVSVTARMWSFEISDRSLPAGEPVRFTAESADTVHSFAVYDPDGDLLFTRMLIPGTTQAITHSFDEPGTYTVRCLEYCGRGHSAMRDELEVKR